MEKWLPNWLEEVFLTNQKMLLVASTFSYRVLLWTLFICWATLALHVSAPPPTAPTPELLFLNLRGFVLMLFFSFSIRNSPWLQFQVWRLHIYKREIRHLLHFQILLLTYVFLLSTKLSLFKICEQDHICKPKCFVCLVVQLVRVDSNSYIEAFWNWRHWNYTSFQSSEKIFCFQFIF